MSRVHRFCILTAVTVLFATFAPQVSLLAAQADAIPGTPFGIGQVTVQLPAKDAVAGMLHQGGYLLSEKNGRVFYPVFTSGALKRALGSNGDVPATSLTALFLFTGQEPLELTLSTPTNTKIVVAPKARKPRTFTRMLRQWWRQYNGAARAQMRQGDYPSLIETYLTSMLSQRMNLAPPLLTRIQQDQPSQPQQSLQLLLGVESLRSQIARDTMMRGGGLGEVAKLPLPADIPWRERLWPKIPTDIDIEPIAMHVPQECFYIRFGQFTNYLWLDDLATQYGGDIGRMLNLRGHDTRRNERLQRQLALKRTALAKVFGPQVIADVALIGRDLYMREGAAVGVLFQARNDLLTLQLSQQRKDALKENENIGATLKTVKIAGHAVSLLSTPDNRLRSFYAVDGKYHLVTTSRAIIQRFFEAGMQRGALGASAEFRHARTAMPTQREDTIFVYLSSAFFRGLVSPQYQIEQRRRLESVTDMELLALARYAARAERRPSETIEDLVRAKLLPAGFGRRADGSGSILSDGETIDSLRGAHGTFLPVPDVQLRSVTAGEAARYAANAEFYRQSWTEMDPIMIGIKRYAIDRQGRERVTFDANITPLAEEKYGKIMSALGPPTTKYIVAPPSDAIFMQAMLKGGLLAPDIPPHHMFLGVRDDTSVTEFIPSGFLQMLKLMKSTPSYIGAWPKTGFLDRLPFGLSQPPDATGYSSLPFGLWRRQLGDFSAVSFDKEILATATPHLKVAEAKTAAQIRVAINDLSRSKLASQINALNYERARQTSTGNVRLLHALTQQLQVPPEKALTVAEDLLDVELVCSLGGKYETVRRDGGLMQWQSTAWPQHKASGRYDLPKDYTAPLLTWFRGLGAELTKDRNRLIVHAHLDMQRPEAESKIKLPLLDIFNGKKKKPKEF